MFLCTNHTTILELPCDAFGLNLIQWFGKQICTLILCVNCMNRNISLDDMITEMMILHIEMLGSGPGLVLGSHDERATVVLEHLAVHLRLVLRQVETMLLELLDQLHQGNAFTQCRAESDVF